MGGLEISRTLYRFFLLGWLAGWMDLLYSFVSETCGCEYATLG